MSQTQYDADYDYEYDTGRTIPRDSAGWRNFAEERNRKLKNWTENAFISPDDSTFFNISFNKQKILQDKHPSLKEAWKIYLTLLQVTNE